MPNVSGKYCALVEHAVAWHGPPDTTGPEAWTSGLPRRQTGTFSDGPGGYAAVLPLRVGMRIVGLVGIERLESPFPAEQLTMIEDELRGR